MAVNVCLARSRGLVSDLHRTCTATPGGPAPTGIPHAAHRSELANGPSRRRVLYLPGRGGRPLPGPHLPADRLRAELPVSTPGLHARPRRQRGTVAAAGPT